MSRRETPSVNVLWWRTAVYSSSWLRPMCANPPPSDTCWDVVFTARS